MLRSPSQISVSDRVAHVIQIPGPQPFFDTNSYFCCIAVNCGTLPTPSNAEKISETSTFLNGQVTFRCIGREFKLVGSATRTCLASRLWSGQQPSCKRTSVENSC